VVAGGGSLALGLGAKLLDRDVPRPVKSELNHVARPIDMGPKDGAPPWIQRMERSGTTLVKGSAHLVLRQQTPLGPVRLYVARTTQGGWCMVSKGGGSGGATCNPTGAVYARYPISMITTRSHRRVLLVGWAGQSGAAAVAMLYGSVSHRIPLVEGWFVYDVPRPHQAHGATPVTAIDDLDADGRRLASLRDPLRLHAPPVRFEKPVPSSIHLLFAQTLPNGGGRVTIREGRSPSGHRCFMVLRNGRSQLGPAWQCRADVNRWGSESPTSRHVPVMWQMGLRNDARKGPSYGWAYAYGWVAPNVAALKLRFQDGSQVDIPLRHGDFLYVVPPANWPDGHRPSILLAYDARGRQVYRRFLYPRQHCIYPGSDPLCRNYGTGTG
jgi:hypothetical protein